MKPAYDGPILDNHFHIQPHGRFLDAVRSFQAEGGTHVTHIPIPGRETKTTVPAWREFFEAHLRLSDRIEAETQVRVVRAVGPYPIELVHHFEKAGLEAARDGLRAGYEAAFQLLREGRAHALGEVGRAHFPVPEPVQRLLTDLLEEALAVAGEIGVAVILHTEHATAATFAEFAEIANRARFPLERLVKHYAPPAVRPEENHGLVPSIIASRSNITEAAAKGSRFLMETDYIDEPTRPDVVLPPTAVPKRSKALLEQGVSPDLLFRVHRDLPASVYRVAIEPGGKVS